MTCEIVVMNKFAAVIAADSAVTVTNFQGNDSYLKGVNKIFQLSIEEPVSVMMYGSSLVAGVPWEIIIKNFRKFLSGKKFPHLSQYAETFFSYVIDSKYYFPSNVLDANFVTSIHFVAKEILKWAIQSYPLLSDQNTNVVTKLKWWDTWAADFTKNLQGNGFPPEILESEHQAALDYLLNFLATNASVNEDLAQLNLFGVIKKEDIYTLACEYFFKNYRDVLKSIGTAAGLVFSGYGTDQYFPEVIEYQVCGFVGHNFRYFKSLEGSQSIAHDRSSWLREYPESPIIHSYIKGIDVDSYQDGVNLHKQYAKQLIIDTLNDAGVQIPANIDEKVGLSSVAFFNELAQRSMMRTYQPMLRVIWSLPISEMIHLAETLITLQSLKNRMTTFGESVSGAIDIAVITKSEGMVWVKRKHFFDSNQNLRYVLRQKSGGGISD